MRLIAYANRSRLGCLLLIALLLGACASAPPALDQTRLQPQWQLSPASFGRTLALQQRLRVVHGERQQSATALLQIDDESLRLALVVGPRRMLSLNWDGQTLIESRDPALPPGLQGAHFVDDILLAYWPTDILQAHLPAGWHLRENAGVRELQRANGERVVVRYSEATRWLGHIVIEHPDAGYVLELASEELP